MSEKKEVKVSKASEYTKQQFLKGKAFAKHKDLINALLDSSKKYSKDEVKTLIDNYLKKAVN